MDLELPWIEKYRPQTFSDFIGNMDVVSIAMNFIETWIIDRPMKQILILAGKNGIGKTTLPIVLANEYRLDWFRFNASENRTHKELQGFKRECLTKTFSRKKKIMILDEFDYAHKTAKTTGLKWIIENTRHPIFVTVNDIRSIPYESIRKRADVMILRFESPTNNEIQIVLNRIAKAEKIENKKELITEISLKLKTFRGAISAFERGWIEEDDTLEDVDDYELTKRILRNEKVNITLSPERLITWLFDNTKKNQELFKLADESLAHTRELKNYRFWKYAHYFLSQCRDSKIEKAKFPVSYTLNKTKKSNNIKVLDLKKASKTDIFKQKKYRKL